MANTKQPYIPSSLVKSHKTLVVLRVCLLDHTYSHPRENSQSVGSMSVGSMSVTIKAAIYLVQHPGNWSHLAVTQSLGGFESQEKSLELYNPEATFPPFTLIKVVVAKQERTHPNRIHSSNSKTSQLTCTLWCLYTKFFEVVKLLGWAWARPTLAGWHCWSVCVYIHACLLACGHIP